MNHSQKVSQDQLGQVLTVTSHQLMNMLHHILYMGVSKNKGTPKWMVYNGTPY